MPALLAMLMQNGLGLLGNALMQKGQDVLEDKLGVKLTPQATPDQILELKKLEFQHEEWLVTAGQEKMKLEIEAEQTEQLQVTERWKADMTSDSWLSKNIRPIVLISVLGLFAVLALLSACKFNVDAEYVSLLKEWGMLSLGAYFGGRSLEKITNMKTGGTP